MGAKKPPCAGLGDLFYSDIRADQTEAKGICFGCPVRLPCLARALEEREEFGIWGGMSANERRRELRNRRRNR